MSNRDARSITRVVAREKIALPDDLCEKCAVSSSCAILRCIRRLKERAGRGPLFVDTAHLATEEKHVRHGLLRDVVERVLRTSNLVVLVRVRTDDKPWNSGQCFTFLVCGERAATVLELQAVSELTGEELLERLGPAVPEGRLTPSGFAKEVKEKKTIKIRSLWDTQSAVAARLDAVP